MDIVCSPAGTVSPYFPKQGIMDMVNAGFENVFLETGIGCSGYELEHYGKDMEKRESSQASQRGNKSYCVSERPWELGEFFEKMLHEGRRKGLSFPVARGPFLLRGTKREDLKELLCRLNEEAIGLCGRAGSSYLIVRPWSAGVGHGKEWEENRGYYLRLAAFAKERGITLLLENQCKDFCGHLVRGICSDGREAARWVDCLNAEAGEERFGFCMDVGACNLCGQNLHDFALSLGHRLKAVILRDCNGSRETSLLPFTCAANGQAQTDWLGLFRGLRRIDFDGQLILDFADTAAAFSPILRPKLMELAKETGEYFRWQIRIEGLLKKYPSRVLFGAGNMCRNYMKCYGQAYPPLFTCDNNKELWGTEFCGLEVRPPQSLGELPKGCAVFICNIYYREIEKQLREMGLENPIEFFNDEYMPTFYFDRLEG